MFNFSEKNIVITGGGTGIGFEIALSFFKAKANVMIAGRREKVLREAVDKIKKMAPNHNGNLFYFECDMSKEKEVKNLFSTASDKFSNINILINNCSSWTLEPISDLEINNVKDHINNVYLSTIISTKHGSLNLSEGGSIINISSFSSIIPMKDGSIYSSLKSGINNFTKSSASELANKNIRVNSIIPGVIKTPMTSKYIDKNYKQIVSKISLGRVGTCNEVASVALFLCSDFASYVNGASIEVTGGKFLTQ
tara:strand:+ start:1001 stop:1756 length:756 start_codon:yes stop_codon:yes gene_type:complete